MKLSLNLVEELKIRADRVNIKIIVTGTSSMVQWLGLRAPNARGWGSIPGLGTRSCIPQLKDPAYCY